MAANQTAPNESPFRWQFGDRADNVDEWVVFVCSKRKQKQKAPQRGKIIDTVGRAMLLTHSESHGEPTEEIQEENIKLPVHGVTKARRLGQLNNVISSNNFRSIRIFLMPVVID